MSESIELNIDEQLKMMVNEIVQNEERLSINNKLVRELRTKVKDQKAELFKVMKLNDVGVYKHETGTFEVQPQLVANKFKTG
jgi:hypothetical protein